MSMFQMAPKLTPLNDVARLAQAEGVSIGPTNSELSVQTEALSGRDLLSKNDMVAAGRFVRGESPTEAIQNAAWPIKSGVLHYPTPFTSEQMHVGLRALHQANYSGLNYETLVHGDISQLRETYVANREHLLDAVTTFKSHLGTLALSGRGQQDLNKILTEKRGTYGTSNSIMVIGISRPQELSPEVFMDNLAEAARFAASYSNLQNSTRLAVDPIPGGIVVAQLSMSSITTFERKGSAQMYRESPLNMGESVVNIWPDNFDQRVRGVIPYTSYARFDEAIAHFSHDFRRLADPASASDMGFVNHYNTEVYPRTSLIDRLSADYIVSEALQLFADRNEIR